MSKVFKYQFLVLCLISYFILLISCSDKKYSGRKFTLNIHHAYGRKVFLETLPFQNEKKSVMDSATVKSGNDFISFNIPDTEERPFRLKIDESNLEIYFINDISETILEADILKTDDFKVIKSPATNSLKLFFNQQAYLREKGRKEFLLIDSLSRAKGSKLTIDSLTSEMNRQSKDFFHNYISFADTVSSSGAFLYVYNNIDFGKDYGALKNFIQKASQRFPHHQRIQQLKDETIEYLKIFEEEYNAGDYLPELILPGIEGKSISTFSMKGKYVFMDFWSTWCAPCLVYDKVKLNLKTKLPPDKFEIVSIALDSEKENWLNYLKGKNFSWPQLIDEKVWNGETIRRFKIDSIPFNFLLAPDGKILSKAIKPDSVLTVISNILK